MKMSYAAPFGLLMSAVAVFSMSSAGATPLGGASRAAFEASGSLQLESVLPIERVQQLGTSGPVKPNNGAAVNRGGGGGGQGVNRGGGGGGQGFNRGGGGGGGGQGFNRGGGGGGQRFSGEGRRGGGIDPGAAAAVGIIGGIVGMAAEQSAREQAEREYRQERRYRRQQRRYYDDD